MKFRKLVRYTSILSLALLLNLHSTLLAQVIDLNGSWRFHIGDRDTWAEKDYDDSQWSLIKAPSLWENEGYHGYDGFGWYRKKIDGAKLDKNKRYYLGLGRIDDVDEVYFNGRLIGFSGEIEPNFKTAFDVWREYTIPPDLINYSGENTIAVRVFDVTLDGGIVEGNLGVYESKRNKFLLIDLQGVWSFAKDNKQKQWDNWVHIRVPSHWPIIREHTQRIAWYKYSFSFTGNIPEEQLMLMLGKIDDFDEVYFNGVLIGKTNDHLPYGESKSYQQKRAYAIPARLIHKTGVNTIEIKVEDIGREGGIYEGIIGIATRANFDKYVGF